MTASRRTFLKLVSSSALTALMPGMSLAASEASSVHIVQIVYSGGNWRPRPSALRRLAWEIHKRTAVSTALEPEEVKPRIGTLALSPIAYLSGDRPFDEWSDQITITLNRFLTLGGTLIVDPAITPSGDADGFRSHMDAQLAKILPGVEPRKIPASHVLFRSFYSISRPVGRIEGPPELTGYEIEGRLAIIRTEHDLGGAWARDNLGSWEYEVVPGGERQRENAFRLGINLVLYALCLDYKDEEPHRRFGRQVVED